MRYNWRYWKNSHKIITDHLLYIHIKWLCTCRLKLFSLFFLLSAYYCNTDIVFFPVLLSTFVSSPSSSSKEATLFSFHRLPTEQAWRSHPSSHQGSYYFISSTMSFVKARVHMCLRADSRSMWNPNTMYQRLTTDPAIWPTQGINVRTTEKSWHFTC